MPDIALTDRELIMTRLIKVVSSAMIYYDKLIYGI